MSETFNMDGIEHRIGDTKCCIGSSIHNECGGIWHHQAVYGGYYYECDKCHEKK